MEYKVMNKNAPFFKVLSCQSLICCFTWGRIERFFIIFRWSVEKTKRGVPVETEKNFPRWRWSGTQCLWTEAFPRPQGEVQARCQLEAEILLVSGWLYEPLAAHGVFVFIILSVYLRLNAIVFKKYTCYHRKNKTAYLFNRFSLTPYLAHMRRLCIDFLV